MAMAVGLRGKLFGSSKAAWPMGRTLSPFAPLLATRRFSVLHRPITAEAQVSKRNVLSNHAWDTLEKGLGRQNHHGTALLVRLSQDMQRRGARHNNREEIGIGEAFRRGKKEIKKWLFKGGNSSAALKISLIVGGTSLMGVVLYYSWKVLLGLGVAFFIASRIWFRARQKLFKPFFDETMVILQQRRNIVEKAFDAKIESLGFPILKEQRFMAMTYRGPPERQGVVLSFEIGTPMRRGAVWAWATQSPTDRKKYIVREVKVDAVDVRNGAPAGPINSIQLYNNLEDMQSLVDEYKKSKGEEFTNTGQAEPEKPKPKETHQIIDAEVVEEATESEDHSHSKHKSKK